jgi:hypothetical protein
MARDYSKYDPIAQGLAALGQGIQSGQDRQLRARQYEDAKADRELDRKLRERQFDIAGKELEAKADVPITENLLRQMDQADADFYRGKLYSASEDAFSKGLPSSEIKVPVIPRNEFNMGLADSIKTRRENRAQLANLSEQADAVKKVLGGLPAGSDVTIPGFSLKTQAPPSEIDLALKEQRLEAARQRSAQGPKITESQAKAASFAKRMEQAETALKAIEDAGFDKASITSEVQGKGFFPERFKSEAYKLNDQAERNFVTAVLRPESGAAIPEEEMRSARIQYFAQPGDTQAVKDQKAASRQQSIEGLKAQAGQTAYERITTVPPKDAPPANNPPKDVGRQMARAALNRSPKDRVAIRKRFKELYGEEL